MYKVPPGGMSNHAITHTRKGFSRNHAHRKSKKDLSRITHKVDSRNHAIFLLIFTQSRTITQDNKANNAITHTYGRGENSPGPKNISPKKLKIWVFSCFLPQIMGNSAQFKPFHTIGEEKTPSFRRFAPFLVNI